MYIGFNFARLRSDSVIIIFLDDISFSILYFRRVEYSSVRCISSNNF